jgi:hypothetical protein
MFISLILINFFSNQPFIPSWQDVSFPADYTGPTLGEDEPVDDDMVMQLMEHLLPQNNQQRILPARFSRCIFI